MTTSFRGDGVLVGPLGGRNTGLARLVRLVRLVDSTTFFERSEGIKVNIVNCLEAGTK